MLETRPPTTGPPGAPGPDPPGRPWQTRPGLTGALALGVILLLALALLATLGPLRGILPWHPVGPSGAPDGAEVPAFRFGEGRVVVHSLSGKPSGKAGRRAAGAVRNLMGGFYQAAFLEPRTWAEGPGPDTWRFFSPRTVSRAREDARALTVGRRRELRRLEVDRKSITLRVLLGRSMQPQAVIAEVTFVASGALRDGTPVEVRNEASYVLRPVSGGWRIVGYPSARTTVDAKPPPAPTGPEGQKSPGRQEPGKESGGSKDGKGPKGKGSKG